MSVETNYITAEELVERVQSRGYEVEPVEAEDGRFIGYTLKGPRGNRHFLPPTSEGYSSQAADLWCDGVDYATGKIERARAPGR